MKQMYARWRWFSQGVAIVRRWAGLGTALVILVAWIPSLEGTEVFSEGFDGFPDFPVGWTNSPGGVVASWRITSAASDTVPNAAFAPEAGVYGASLLTSPSIFIPTPSARLSFRHRNTSVYSYSRGGLEVSIGGDEFKEFTSAGGAFLANGYSPNSYPYGWGPTSGGFITTEAYLPALAAGKMVRLRWRFTRESSSSSSDKGWVVDTISVTDGRMLLADDISVTLTDAPDPVAVGANLTYVATVTNTGPSTATQVVLTNILPANVTLVSALPSRGTWVAHGNTLICDLGSLPANRGATVTVVVQASANSVLTNRVSVSRVEPDAELPNNTATTTTTVTTPALTVADVSLEEGDAEESIARFNVFLVPASTQTVTLEFATTNGTATAGSDYVATNGVLVFAPGETLKTIRVPIIADLLDETNETFFVSVANPTNALLARGRGAAMIVDDDAEPGFVVFDAWVEEGDGGVTNAVFTVFLTSPSGQPVTFTYSTESYSGTATRGSDYPSTNGTVVFPPGSVVQTAAVPVYGDRVVEANETFYVNFSRANGSWGSYGATALILNDDGLPGKVDRLVWSAVPDAVLVGQPFPVTLTALDYFDQPATNFIGPVAFSARAIQGTVSRTMLASLGHDSSYSGSYTYGYSFTPSTNLVVTHVRHYSGTKVSIWTDDGTLLANQIVTGTIRSWTETPLATPLQLKAGTRYRLGVYAGSDYYGYYRYGNFPESFEHGTRHMGYITYEDGFPQQSTSTRYLVDLRYTVGTLESVAHVPAESGSFTNGIWSGTVAVLGSGGNVILKADDGQGHVGLSNPFDLLVTNDLSLRVSATPDPATVGGLLTYAILVTNTGPADATGVTVTNFLPAGAALVSFASSQGVCEGVGDLLICTLGTLSAAASAQLRIIVSPASLGAVTNTTTVSRAEPDFTRLNNTATIVTAVALPTLSISDAGVVEGNTGTAAAMFAVQLFPACGQTVMVDYSTSDGTAGGGDYRGTNGSLTFGPGETNRTFAVLVNGDLLNESNEVFLVSLSHPTNAIVGRGQAAGTILNDDPQPTLLLYNTALAEGNAGETNAIFLLDLSAPTERPVSVSYSTYYYSGTATQGTDYQPTNGVLVFAPGSTVQTIAVPVQGDTTIESTETFLLRLDSVQNATVGNYQATAFIVNDDGLPGQVHSFAWAEIPPMQPVGGPIAVAISARDYFDNAASNFAGAVSLSAYRVTAEASETLLNAVTHSSSESDYSTTTAGYVFTPNTDLLVTHVRHYSGMKVSLWTDDGILLVSQQVTSVAATWGETALANPVWLSAGHTYRIGVYGGRYMYYRTDGPTSFNHGTIGQGCSSNSDGFPDYSGWWRWPLVDLRYTVRSLQPVTITPNHSGLFVDGMWTGSIELPEGSPLFLRADDGAGHFGESGLFATWGTRLNVQRAGDNVILSWPISATGCVLESAETRTSVANWSACTNTPSILGDRIVVTNPISSVPTLFRLRK